MVRRAKPDDWEKWPAEAREGFRVDVMTKPDLLEEIAEQVGFEFHARSGHTFRKDELAQIAEALAGK